MTSGWDLRLVPAALGTWGICLLIWWVPLPIAGMLWGAGIFAGISAAAILYAAQRAVRSPLASRWGSIRWWVWVTLLATAVAAIAATLAVAQQRQGPLAEAATGRVLATVEVTIGSEIDQGRSTVRGSFVGPPRYTARARLHRIESRLGTWSLDAPVLLQVQADDSLLEPGSVVVAQVRVGLAEFTPQAAAVLQAQGPVEVVAGPSWIPRIIHAVRTGLRDSVAGAPADAAALVVGLAVGDESTQPEGFGEAMRVSGLSHLTAVSGGNVAIVLGVIVIIGRLLGARIVTQVIIAAAALIGYVLVVGPEPSVLRAAGMGTVAVLALLIGGPRRGLSALSATVVLLLILAPVLAVSLGFALSVAATTGLLVVAPPLRRSLRRALARVPGSERVRGVLADAIALTMAAQITTAPILASLGQGLSLVAVPANVLAAPAVAPITVLGLLAAVSAPILPPLGQGLGWLAIPFAAWIAWCARTFAGLDGATLAWPGGLVGALAALAAIGTGAAVIIIGRARHWPLRTAAVVVLAAIAVVWLRPPDRAGWPPPGWVAVACDVGQGDAFVISTGPSRALVVDAGPEASAVDSCLRDLGIDHVELLVLTHFHADHVEGTPGVLAGRRVDALWVSPHPEPVEQVERVQRWAQAAGLTPQSVWVGESTDVGSARTHVLWPARIITEGSIANNASVVLDIRTNGIRLLLLGDVEPAAQAGLRGSRGSQAFDVVKIAHHGSRFQDPRLAQWTAGRIAVISVGADNDYGHPAAETVEAWMSVSARVLRTDQHGDVAIVVRDDTPGGASLGVVTRR